jgi:hypothetical protein
MLIIGCDPGLTGAISLLCSQRGLLECEDLPTCGNGQKTGKMMRWIDADKLQEMLRQWSVNWRFAEMSVHACIEFPIPMPTLPAQTVASQFDTFGVIRALVGCRVGPARTSIVNPQTWKKFYGLGTDKNASRSTAMRLYPSAPVTRVKDHNRSEAILIGHWMLRELA